MVTLARKLRVVDYFTLGWGTMVGVGWLVVMDDWLLRGGSAPSWARVLGFANGGALLLSGRLCIPPGSVMAMPDAGRAKRFSYTAKVFPRSVSLRHWDG